MKFVEIPNLALTSSMLDGVDLGDRKLYGRIELYSCRKTSVDKTLSQTIEQHIEDELASSPAYAASPLGPLSDQNTKRLLINLISTMNESFPDYDFSNLRPEQFTREPHLNFVINTINTNLAEVAEKSTHGFLEMLWSGIESAINIRECDIFSYIPDLVSDPFSETAGILWSLDYFFYDRKQKKILFFALLTKSKSSALYDDELGSDTDSNDGRQRGGAGSDVELDDGEVMFFEDEEESFMED
eukprot:GILI01002940.1.p1 GENE.GILI01002940.1~~GILI01002940.1.p1  ORF type:complete len:243 (+),score=49.18 GILI01002940.1:100-828(+)